RQLLSGPYVTRTRLRAPAFLLEAAERFSRTRGGVLHMPNPNALVDYVAPPDARTLGLAAGGESTVISFRAGRSGRLDMAKPHSRVWASVLDSMRESNAPVYVEIDPATGEITDLRVPLSVGVENITPVGEDMEVELVISHAKHFLRRSNPDFEQLLETLERARANKGLVAVTETEDHDIIDVRPMAGRSVTARRDIPPEISEGPSEPLSVTLGQAQQMFDLVS